MTHEKIIKRDDGVQWRIEVVYNGREYSYEISYFHPREPGVCHYLKRNDPNHPLTPDEIHAAKLELWEKMKPVL